MFLETILCGLAAGAAGAILMNLFLRWVSHAFDEPENMVEVLGSFFTGSRGSTAITLGTVLHLFFGALFGTLYAWVLTLMQAAQAPAALFAGMGFGFVHGLLVSYGLMLFVREQHPVKELRSCSMSVGVLYLIAHTLYGGFVGLVAGLLGLVVSFT